jgi:phospho-N-acetylmuramoyl-pentapeptide-transferase
MLPWLGSWLAPFWGPFRLLQSHGFLIVVGLYVGFAATIWLLPKAFAWLPRDRGKSLVPQGEAARGKPTGGGVVFISLFAVVSLLLVPFGGPQVWVAVLTVLVMVTGYVDDRSTREWGEYLKAAMDFVLALAASWVLTLNGPVQIWLPFTPELFVMPAWSFIPLSTVLIWTSINCTNCSDGVDGLSGTLVLVALVTLGGIFYFVLGNVRVAHYLLLPHLEQGAEWAGLAFTLVGCLAAYLWYNAYPSRVLMGDAGSRALGFFVGVLVMASGNPFLIVMIGTVLLANGGTGLVKVALLRFLKIRILHNTRFPLHDHVRQRRQWSNTQVLLKFTIVQVLITIGLLGVFLKIR